MFFLCYYVYPNYLLKLISNSFQYPTVVSKNEYLFIFSDSCLKIKAQHIFITAGNCSLCYKEMFKINGERWIFGCSNVSCVVKLVMV